MMTEVSEVPDEFIKALKTKKLVYGTKESINAFRKQNAEKIILASNVPDSLMKQINTYTEISDLPVFMFKGNSMDMGAVFKRAHGVLIATIIKV